MMTSAPRRKRSAPNSPRTPARAATSKVGFLPRHGRGRKTAGSRFAARGDLDVLVQDFAVDFFFAQSGECLNDLPCLEEQYRRDRIDAVAGNDIPAGIGVDL